MVIRRAILYFTGSGGWTLFNFTWSTYNFVEGPYNLCLLPHRLLTRTNSDLHRRTFPRLARAFAQYLIKSRSCQKQHMSKSETSPQEEMNSSGSNIIVG